MNKVKVGIVGIGNMGSAHANSIFNGNVKEMELTAVCDINPARKAWAEQNLKGIAFYEDFKELIDSGSINAVIIATPHYLHPVIAVYAFEKGLHVLTEKPAGVYTRQVEEMNHAAKKAGTVFCIMYNQRTNPMYRLAHEMLQQGDLGEPKRLVWIITNWYRTQSYYDSGTWRATWGGEGGGVLINQCPHNLDLWQWIFGMPTRIRGFMSEGKYHHIEVEDDVTAYAEYANGATSVFITTTGELPGTNRLEISGDRGKIVIEEGKMKFWKLASPEREFCFDNKDIFAALATGYEELHPEGVESAHNGILQNFTNAILHGEKLISPGEEGINGLTISNAIHLSSWTDNWVNLPIDQDLYYKKLKEKIANSTIKKNEATSRIADLSGSHDSF